MQKFFIFYLQFFCLYRRLCVAEDENMKVHERKHSKLVIEKWDNGGFWLFISPKDSYHGKSVVITRREARLLLEYLKRHER